MQTFRPIIWADDPFLWTVAHSIPGTFARPHLKSFGAKKASSWIITSFMWSTGPVLPSAAAADPPVFQAECVEAFESSWVDRGSSSVTLANTSGVLPRMLVLIERPAW